MGDNAENDRAEADRPAGGVLGEADRLAGERAIEVDELAPPFDFAGLSGRGCERIMAAMDEFNRRPVVRTWSYTLDQAA